MEAHAGEYIRNYLHVKRFPRISLVCKPVPVQYREYEYGLFRSTVTEVVNIDNDRVHCFSTSVWFLSLKTL